MRINYDFNVSDDYYWEVFRKINNQFPEIMRRATAEVSCVDVACLLNPDVDRRIILDCVHSIALSNSI